MATSSLSLRYETVNTPLVELEESKEKEKERKLGKLHNYGRNRVAMVLIGVNDPKYLRK